MFRATTNCNTWCSAVKLNLLNSRAYECVPCCGRRIAFYWHLQNCSTVLTIGSMAWYSYQLFTFLWLSHLYFVKLWSSCLGFLIRLPSLFLFSSWNLLHQEFCAKCCSARRLRLKLLGRIAFGCVYLSLISTLFIVYNFCCYRTCLSEGQRRFQLSLKLSTLQSHALSPGILFRLFFNISFVRPFFRD